LSKINPKIESSFPVAGINDHTQFHENRFKTFCVILPTDKQTLAKTESPWRR